MKTSFKTIIFAAAFSVLFTFNASASDKETKKAASFGTGIFVSKNGKLNVSIDKYNETATVVELVNAQGKTVYREVLGSNDVKYRRAFDVSELPSGDYTLQIKSKGEKVSKNLRLDEKIAVRTISID